MYSSVPSVKPLEISACCFSAKADCFSGVMLNNACKYCGLPSSIPASINAFFFSTKVESFSGVIPNIALLYSADPGLIPASANRLAFSLRFDKVGVFTTSGKTLWPWFSPSVKYKYPSAALAVFGFLGVRGLASTFT